MSSQFACKRPLPPSDLTPLVSKKRKPLNDENPQAFPRLRLSSSSDGENDDDILQITGLNRIKENSSPVLSRKMSEQSDASPELCAPKSYECDAVSPLKYRPFNLGPRQFSAPVTTAVMPIPFREPLSKAHSENNISIMNALERSQQKEGELTGDFSNPLCLPTVLDSRHPDITSITPDTMARLIRGDFDDRVGSFKILDCRFPYEYEGGHIVGAESWSTLQYVVDYLQTKDKTSSSAPVSPGDKRDILIFHCEFSAERGPRAQRLLRELDRTMNKERYPALHFPEIYLLEGGYKAFFESHSDLCVPQCYTKMRDSNFAEDLKMCRAKSKTWASENKQNKGRTSLRLK